MSRLINPVVLSGTILGYCPKCGGDYKGFFQTPHKEILNVAMVCMNCDHSGEYFMHVKDGLPKVQLRHKKNRQLVSSGKKGPRRKKKKENPDGVLRGQMAFDIPNAALMRAGIIT